MFLIILMLFDPETGWQRAVESGRRVWRTLVLHLGPMLLLGCVAEGYGILHWGKPAGDFGARQTFGLAAAVQLEAAHLVAGLFTAVVAALMLRPLADTFQRRQSYSRALVVSVFALGPVYLARVADAFPAVHPWLSWVFGALLTVTLLYQGLPRVFHIDPAHALGLYFSASLLLILVSGLSRLLVVMVLEPRLLVAGAG